MTYQVEITRNIVVNSELVTDIETPVETKQFQSKHGARLWLRRQGFTETKSGSYIKRSVGHSETNCLSIGRVTAVNSPDTKVCYSSLVPA